MTLALKILCGLYGALVTLLGVRWLFAFDDISAEWQVQALNALGINNLIADMGGLFLGTAVLIGVGLIPRYALLLVAAAILMIIAALGRLYAYATLGYVPETLVPLIFEIGSATLLFGTYLRANREKTETG